MNNAQMTLLIKALANTITTMQSDQTIESILIQHGCGAVDLMDLSCDHMAIVYKDFSDGTFLYTYRNKKLYRHKIEDNDSINRVEISHNEYITARQHAV